MNIARTSVRRLRRRARRVRSGSLGSRAPYLLGVLEEIRDGLYRGDHPMALADKLDEVIEAVTFDAPRRPSSPYPPLTPEQAAQVAMAYGDEDVFGGAA